MADIVQNLSRIHLFRATDHTTFGDVTYRAGGQFGPRNHSDYQVVLLHAGHADIFIDDDPAPRRVAAGEATLLPPGHRDYFFFAVHSETRHSWGTIHPSLIEASFARDLVAAPPVVPYSQGLTSIIRLALAIRTPRTASSDRLVDQLGAAALSEYLLAAAGLQSTLPAAIERACVFIERHFAEPQTLSSIARIACVTPAHLIRLFKLHLGTTPSRHLWRTRVEAAVHLLRETGLSIGEIAERTGFQNPFHLSRLVKRSYEASPVELRRRMWSVSGHPRRSNLEAKTPASTPLSS